VNPSDSSVRITRGEPSDAEVAALTVVLAAAAAASGSDAEPHPRAVWADPSTAIRGQLPVGPGRWRTTYWPRGADPTR